MYIISTLLKDLTIEQFLMQHFSDRKKASITSSFSSRRGAIYDASQVKNGAIYYAPWVRSGAIITHTVNKYVDMVILF